MWLLNIIYDLKNIFGVLEQDKLSGEVKNPIGHHHHTYRLIFSEKN